MVRNVYARVTFLMTVHPMHVKHVITHASNAQRILIPVAQFVIQLSFVTIIVEPVYAWINIMMIILIKLVLHAIILVSHVQIVLLARHAIQLKVDNKIQANVNVEHFIMMIIQINNV